MISHRVRAGLVTTIVTCGLWLAAGCQSLNGSGVEFGGGQPGGGATATTGGTQGSGGSIGTGGVPAQGGSPGTGGAAATGGAPATGGAAGGAAGQGGSGGMCADVDKDGQTTCAGDCNDNDPANWQGNAEVCGDMADNNCSGTADENCNGLGTFVSAGRGNDNNNGTKVAPVRTINKGIQNARTLGGNNAVYVADGVYTEKVNVAEGIDLLGGHECNAATCTWLRDSTKFISRIQATDSQGTYVDHGITRATLVDGFEIAGQDGAAVNQGRIALTINGGAPTITRNRILGPQTGGGGYPSGRSIAVMILAPVTDAQGASIDSNEIRGGRSESEGCVGIAMEGSTSNGPSRARITNNTITGGRGRWSDGISAWSSGPGTLVEGNGIFAGRADTDEAFAIAFGGTLDINDNALNTDVNLTGTCSGSAYCGGITSDSGTGTITNNVIRGMNAPNSVGVILREAERATGLVVLNGNTIDAGGLAGGGVSRALVLWIGSCNSCGFNGQVGRIRNNILLAGTGTNRFGVFEDAPAGKRQEPLAFENNLIFFPAAQGRNDAFYREFTGSTQRLHLTITDVNTMVLIPSNVIGNNIGGDPRLDATGHLMAGSPAVDRGTATDAPPLDMDRQKRPNGNAVDIGADEI